MANLLTNDASPTSKPLSMSNALTQVFFDVLALSGCDLATTPWETKLVYWLVQHDQTRCGSGTIGFDVSAMGWTNDGFESEQRFVSAMIEAALRQHGWERLPYKPHQDLVFHALRTFLRLIHEFPISALDGSAGDDWSPVDAPDGRVCDKHRIYLHESGCRICNG